MPNKAAAPHAIFDFSTDIKKLLCKNCGREFIVTLPIDLSMFIPILKAWEKTHKHCKPRMESGA